MTLYHYTSNETFLSIIQNKILYLSDLRLSNDADEGNYAFQLVKEIIAEDKRWAAEKFNFDLMGDISVALGFCLSSEGDLLSQWRAYASDGDGISIGFSHEYLDKLVNNEDNSNHPFQLTKVDYDRDSQKKKLRELLDFDRNKIPDQKGPILGCSAEDRNERQRREQIDRYLSLLIPVILDLYTYKNSFFIEEQEWRMIHTLTRDMLKHERKNIDFRLSGGRIVPFFRFPLVQVSKFSQQETISAVIDKVILGPKNNTPEYVIEALLNKNGFKDVEITRSKGSYR